MSLLDELQKESEIAEGKTGDIKVVVDNFDEDHVPELVNEIFMEAVKKHASDIHFKPLENKLMVYFRVDGQMIMYKEYDKIFHHPIVARIKIISGLKIDEHRLPQDGKSKRGGPARINTAD